MKIAAIIAAAALLAAGITNGRNLNLKQEQQCPCFFIVISTFSKFFLKICKLCLTIGVHLYYTIVKLKVRTKGDEKYEQRRH